MAIANDSIYVNIIAKTQDAVSGINSILRAVTLTGAGFFAFRLAVRAAGDAINFLRQADAGLDKELKEAQETIRGIIGQALEPMTNAIEDAVFRFNALAKAAKEAGGEAKLTADILREAYAQKGLNQAVTNLEKLFADAIAADAAVMKSFENYMVSRFGKDWRETQTAEEIYQARVTEAFNKTSEAARSALDAEIIYWEKSLMKAEGSAEKVIAILTNLYEERNRLSQITTPKPGEVLPEARFPAIPNGWEDILGLNFPTMNIPNPMAGASEENMAKLTAGYEKIARYAGQIAISMGEALATGDIASFFSQMMSMLAGLAMEAAASSAIAMNWPLMTFWLGVAGVSAFAGGLTSGGGGQNMPNSTPAYPIYSGSGRSITVVNNIGGSVITERHMAAVTAKYMSEY